ncbi:hypothetical protein BS47DRAFT_510087 [Hydnum rufescens UP504]|uniref:Uncharacterized protein n=1 Tax=Hydnum rufescens UP504 TaxID=1448309 RepID=A0A9P6B4U4_9AGAM|nr:hypothetical protein BS47DRAFT_510087 [Hydnum rufescens UP504]
MHVRQSPASQRDPSPAASGTGRSHQTIKKDPEGVLSPLIIISDESSNDELDRISKLQFSFVETTENAIKKESEDVSPPSSSSSDTAPMDPDQNNRGADDERWRGVHSQSTESGNAQRGAPGRRSSTEKEPGRCLSPTLSIWVPPTPTSGGSVCTIPPTHWPIRCRIDNSTLLDPPSGLSEPIPRTAANSHECSPTSVTRGRPSTAATTPFGCLIHISKSISL